MGRSMWRTPLWLLLAALVVCLGMGRGIAAAAEKGKGTGPQNLTAAEAKAAVDAADRTIVRVNPDGSPRNLLLEMQDRAAAKRAAEGMMRGVTSTQRWEAARRHADRRAAEERGKAGQPPGKGGAK
ncbi:MAG TPA: hypothetical protein VI078_08905 [bacterium]